MRWPGRRGPGIDLSARLFVEYDHLCAEVQGVEYAVICPVPDPEEHTWKEYRPGHELAIARTMAAAWAKRAQELETPVVNPPAPERP